MDPPEPSIKVRRLRLFSRRGPLKALTSTRKFQIEPEIVRHSYLLRNRCNTNETFLNGSFSPGSPHAMQGHFWSWRPSSLGPPHGLTVSDAAHKSWSAEDGQQAVGQREKGSIIGRRARCEETPKL